MDAPRARSEKLVRDEEVLRYLIAGYKVREIAAIKDVSYQSMLRTCRRPEFMEQLKLLSDIVYRQVDEEIGSARVMIKDRAEELAAIALERLAALIESDDERVAMTATSRALDMNTQTAKVTRGEINNNHSFINPLQLANAAKAADEIAVTAVVPTTESGETIQ